MTAFNLVDEPWIPVLGKDGEHRHVSIADALLHGNDIARIAAELPTVSIALQRTLQAILLRVHQDLPRSVEARARLWGEWWENRGLPADEIEAYLTAWRNRFDLLHPEYPFFQVPGLALASGKGSGLTKLIADVPAGTKFFVTRARSGVERLSYAEAAQWLVHAQAFDCAGIKSGVIGDARVKGGKSYSFGYPAWAGNLGIVSPEGDTLRETLMLNLVLSATSAEDTPIWERASQRIASDGIYSAPKGAAQVWTWPSRMIRLITGDEAVVDVVLSNGEKLEPHNRFRVEPMTSWRYSEPQSKKLKIHVHMPVLHNPERAAWRGLSGLLAQSPGGEESKGKLAGVLDWMQELRSQEAISEGRHIQLRCIAMLYGAQASTFASDFDDVIPVSVAALTTRRLREIAVDAVDVARAGVLKLRDFARNIALAAGDSGDDVGNKIKSVDAEAYDQLRPHFDRWIAGLLSTSSELEVMTGWQRTVARVLYRTAATLDRQAPQSAVVGRVVQLRSGPTHLDVGKAWIWFSGSLRKALPLAQTHPTPPQEGTDDVPTDSDVAD